jgi:hypothetical protein
VEAAYGKEIRQSIASKPSLKKKNPATFFKTGGFFHPIAS